MQAPCRKEEALNAGSFEKRYGIKRKPSALEGSTSFFDACPYVHDFCVANIETIPLAHKNIGGLLFGGRLFHIQLLSMAHLLTLEADCIVWFAFLFLFFA